MLVSISSIDLSQLLSVTFVRARVENDLVQYMLYNKQMFYFKNSIWISRRCVLCSALLCSVLCSSAAVCICLFSLVLSWPLLKLVFTFQDVNWIHDSDSYEHWYNMSLFVCLSIVLIRAPHTKYSNFNSYRVDL